MKTLKNFNEFVNENLKTDDITTQYLKGSITEKEFYDHINNELVTEGLFGDVSKFVYDKIVRVVGSFLAQSHKLGSVVLNKLWGFIESVLVGFLNRISESNPQLKKAILTFVVTAMVMMVASPNASATTTGGDPVKPSVEMAAKAIQFIETHKDSLLNAKDDDGFYIATLAILEEAQENLKNGVDVDLEPSRVRAIREMALKNVQELASTTDKGDKDAIDKIGIGLAQAK